MDNDIQKMEAVTNDLAQVLNRNGMENGSNTPDFLLAELLHDQLLVWDTYVKKREEWYGIHLVPGCRIKETLEAVLLYHETVNWTPEKKEQWYQLTGRREVTTDALCTVVYSMLLTIQKGRS